MLISFFNPSDLIGCDGDINQSDSFRYVGGGTQRGYVEGYTEGVCRGYVEGVRRGATQRGYAEGYVGCCP